MRCHYILLVFLLAFVSHSSAEEEQQQQTSNDPVTVTLSVKKDMQDEQATKHYVVKMKNNSEKQICRIELKIDANLGEKWNLYETSSGTFRTPSFIKLSPGDIVERTGFIAHGDANVSVANVRYCQQGKH